MSNLSPAMRVFPFEQPVFAVEAGGVAGQAAVGADDPVAGHNDRDGIVADSAANAELKASLDAKEHYGRENYYMKRADEDIFVIK